MKIVDRPRNSYVEFEKIHFWTATIHNWNKLLLSDYFKAVITDSLAYQKLDYLHLNPMAKDWNLVTEPCDYTYSSASFYEKGDSRFKFLKHIGDEL